MSSIMDSFRKWFYKPRRDDTSHLAQFFYADEALNMVAAELDSFDGRKDPERCTTLVNHLRQCQDKVLTICNRIMDEMIPNERADRDFRVKFPDDVMQDNLAGQLWFGAECLAAGSSIMNRETESGAMRPLAKALTKALENVRNLLRDAALRSHSTPPTEIQTDKLTESLKVFDRLLADFELAYVSAMVPVKTVQEYELQQCVVVLFSETLHRALKMGLLTQEMVDQYDPALMFTIPRLAIVTGLLIYPHGPLSLGHPSTMSEMFRPFKTLLLKIRELLWTLTEEELLTLEKMLCSSEDTILPQETMPRVISDKGMVIEETGREEEAAEVEEVCRELFQRSNAPQSPLHDPHPQIILLNKSDGMRSPESAQDSEGTSDNSLSYKVDKPSTSSDWVFQVIPCECSSAVTCECPQPEIPSMRSREPSQDNINNNSFSEDIPEHHFEDDTSDSGWGETSKYAHNWDSLASQPQDIRRSDDEGEQMASSFSSSCSSCHSTASPKSDSLSSDTSSYNSDCHNDVEVALAVRAAELRYSQEARAKYRSSEDLVHRLFVCIAGVADQLQTNFAGDLRNILKAVFLINASDRSDYEISDEQNSDCCERGEDAVVWGEREVESPPTWVPDQAAPSCMSCQAPFTVVRRRHHCRNCGKIFCARCSSNSVPLPRYGHLKPVRVCNRCFIYQVTPFTIEQQNVAAAN